MFKKHTYTCPDVIHMKKIGRRNIIAGLAFYAAVVVGAAIVLKVEEKKADTELRETYTRDNSDDN